MLAVVSLSSLGDQGVTVEQDTAALVFTIQRTPEGNEDFASEYESPKVYYEITGGVDEDDYQFGGCYYGSDDNGNYVQFGYAQPTAELVIHVRNDAMNENDEALTVTLTSVVGEDCCGGSGCCSSGCCASGPIAYDLDASQTQQATVTIQDDDDWEIKVERTSPEDQIPERGGQATFTISRADKTAAGNGDENYGIRVEFAMSGDAGESLDYVLRIGGQQINAQTRTENGESSTYYEVTIPKDADSVDVALAAKNDSENEEHESAELTLSGGSSIGQDVEGDACAGCYACYWIEGGAPFAAEAAADNASVSIRDDDDWEIRVERTLPAPPDDGIVERSGEATFVISKVDKTTDGNGDPDYAIEVEFSMSGDDDELTEDADELTDYVLKRGDATIPPSEFETPSGDTDHKYKATIPKGDDSVTVTLQPTNDAKREQNEPAVLTVIRGVSVEATAEADSGSDACCSGDSCCGGTSCCGTTATSFTMAGGHPFDADTSAGTATVTIQDDDNWSVKLERAAPSGSEPNATERMPDVKQDPGYFHVARYDADPSDELGVGDTGYPIHVQFNISGSADRGADFTLSALAPTGVGGALESVSGPTFVEMNSAGNEVWSITILVGQTDGYVKVNPVFDWKDEGQPGNRHDVQPPYTEAGYGEYIAATMVQATWPGIAPADNPVGSPTSANPIVIHDGGIVRVRVDSNGDGAIDASDDGSAVKNHPDHPGHVLLVNSDDDNENGTEDRSERPANFNVPSNGSAFVLNPPAGSSVTVDGEDDLAKALFYVWVDSLDPEDAAAPVEVDVYALAPSDLVMWSQATKGVRIHRGSDSDGDGRIDVNTGLHTLTAGDTTWTAAAYVEANARVTGTIALYADPVGSSASTGSDHAKMTAVAQGEWDVTRDQQPQADAISSAGDTIVGLADQIGFNSWEWQDWLKPSVTNQIVMLEDGTSIPFAALATGSELAAGQTFLIPNTILMAWLGECGSAGQSVMNWSDNVSDLGALGFNVQQFDNDSYAPTDPVNAESDFLDAINNLSSDAYLHGMYFMGHGWTDSIMAAEFYPWSNTIGPLWDVTYADIDNETMYDVASLIIHACYGADSDAEAKLVSDNGIFWGHSGVFYPQISSYPQSLAAHWGYSSEYHTSLTGNGLLIETFGGEQETKVFTTGSALPPPPTP